MPISWLRDTCEQPFGYFRLAGAFSALMLLPLCIAYAVVSDPARIHEEGGVVESLSVVYWLVAMLICIVGLFRYKNHLAAWSSSGSPLFAGWRCKRTGPSRAAKSEIYRSVWRALPG